MSNVSDIFTSNYNLTGLISGTSAVDAPADYVSLLQSVSGVPLTGALLVGVGLVLFFIMRKNVSSDSEALAYSGLVTSIAGILLFLVKSSSGVPLVGWGFLVPVFIITSFAIFSNMTARNY